MGSLSDLFRRYNRILEDAFDLDETNTLVVKNPTKVSEADKAFHRALVTDMGSILNELVAPDRRHDDEYQHVQLPPSLLGRPLGNDEVAPYAPIRTAPTARPGMAATPSAAPAPGVARPMPAGSNDNRPAQPLAGNRTPAREPQPSVDYTPGSFIKTLGISPGQYNVFRGGIAGIEHARYDQMGGSSGRYAGRYQMGPNEIRNSAKLLGEQPPDTKQFLNDPHMQERYFEAYTLDHHNTLMKNPKYANAAPEEQLKILGYAHNQGPGGASHWLNTGNAGHDAFGTSGTAYYNRIGSGLEGLKQNPQQMQPAQPTQVSANTQNRPASPYMAIGDSLALGVGGHLGNTNYTHGSYNPADVNGLVGRAIQNGDVSGKHIILSGGASNAGGNTGMVNQYYPSMIKNLKDAGASQVTVMGVGPYSHYNNYGYHDAINKAATEGGANYTGPLAGIAPFKGNSVQQQVHPTDYQPILSHIQKNFSGTPTQTASAQPSPTPPSPTTPSPIKPIQTAQATPPQPAPTPATPTPVPQPQSTPSPTPTPPSKPTQIASNESRNYRGRTMISLIRGI